MKRPGNGPAGPPEPAAAAGKAMAVLPPAAALSGHPRRRAAASQLRSGSGCDRADPRDPPPIDLAALQADPTLIDRVPVAELPGVLERCAVAHDRLAAVERLTHGRLRRELAELTQAGVGLLTARQAGKRLGVSPDYVRAHGDALGITVPLDGVVRYDPAAIDHLRRIRRDRPPRD